METEATNYAKMKMIKLRTRNTFYSKLTMEGITADRFVIIISLFS